MKRAMTVFLSQSGMISGEFHATIENQIIIA